MQSNHSQYEQTLRTLEQQREEILRNKEEELAAVEQGIAGMQNLLKIERHPIESQPLTHATQPSNGRSLLRAGTDGVATLERPVAVDDTLIIDRTAPQEEEGKKNAQAISAPPTKETAEATKEQPATSKPADSKEKASTATSQSELEKLGLPPSSVCKTSIIETIYSYLKGKKSQTTLTQVVNKFYSPKIRNAWTKKKAKLVTKEIKSILDKNEDSLWTVDKLRNTYYVLESLNENNKP